jgi:hypothetical protein
MALLRKHAAFLLLLLVAAPLIVSFAAHDGITTVGDDSVSYLTLARHYAGTAGPFLEPWARFQGHFPPLFPLALALAGGATGVLAAHVVVALFAIAALAMVYAYGWLRFERPVPALLLALAFLATPTAWIGVKGILSEPMYLFLSLAALCHYEWRLERAPGARAADWALFGLLLAAVALTRAAGMALVLAYAVHALVRLVREPGVPRWKPGLPLAIALAALGLWIAMRPSPDTDNYALSVGGMLRAWVDEPWTLARLSWGAIGGGWISTFTASAEVSPVPKLVFAVVALLALAGSVRRALANRLDGWYALAGVAMVFAWVFPEGDIRRLLYPLVPLLLAHAAGFVIALAERVGGLRHRRLVLAGLALVPVLVCLPATLLVAQKSQDNVALVPGHRYAAADITDYYTILNTTRARAMAARQAAVLYGLEQLKRETPPDARILWVRPEYVALLGGREAVPFYNGWDAHALAEAIRSSRATHVVLATLYKSDLRWKMADPMPVMKTAGGYARRQFSVRSAVTGGEEFALLKVDAEALDAFLARGD